MDIGCEKLSGFFFSFFTLLTSLLLWVLEINPFQEADGFGFFFFDVESVDN